MSTVVQLFQDISFDAETTRAMGAAYDKACRTLHDTGQPELIREIIAKRIVKVAKDGERDPDKLCELALEALGFSNYLRRQG